MTQNGTLFNIVDGPGKWDILTAFGNAKDGAKVVFHYFAGDSRMKIRTQVTILSLEHNGHSGDCWDFKAHAWAMPSGRDEKIKGYYSSQTRSGHFKIEQ